MRGVVALPAHQVAGALVPRAHVEELLDLEDVLLLLNAISCDSFIASLSCDSVASSCDSFVLMRSGSCRRTARARRGCESFGDSKSLFYPPKNCEPLRDAVDLPALHYAARDSPAMAKRSCWPRPATGAAHARKVLAERWLASQR